MLNVVALMGRIVADPELRHTATGIAVARFSIAVQRSYVRAGEERKTDFFDVVAWRSTAEFVSTYFKKGQLIAVDGSIQTGSYQDKDGIKRKTFEIVANNVHFAESKKNSMYDDNSDNQNFAEEKGSVAYSNGSDEDFQKVQSDEDLPF